MGTYNPDIPILVGQQWVPIRNEDQVFKPNQDAVEVGHRFSTNTGYTLNDGRFYLSDWSDAFANTQGYGISIYPQGREDQTGPIRRVVIPCNAAATTGDAGVISTAAQALQGVFNPSDSVGANSYSGGTIASKMAFFFAVNQYSQMLQGKRILAVNYLYQVKFGSQPASPNWTRQLSLSLTGDVFGVLLGAISSGGIPTFDIDTGASFEHLFALKMGELNSITYQDGITARPWTYAELQRFEATAASRMFIQWSSSSDVTTTFNFQIGYSALEVIFCEETRVAAGVTVLGTTNTNNPPVNNTNLVVMKDPVALTTGPALAAGDYTVTLHALDLGFLADPSALAIVPPPITPLPMNAIRQLYRILPHRGVELTHPYPMDESAVGKTFTFAESDVLPQISLHQSGGTITEPHAYGRQAVAQVYGGVTATQDIFDSTAAITGFSYPQVRFYARRFGDTVQPLNLYRASNPAQIVSITPADFDALPPSGGIIDGWKEVTLRFPSASIPGFSGTTPSFKWESLAETAGNRWEVLGAFAPALSGTPGNMLNQINPTTQRLGPATYGAPGSGATVELTWVPGWAPPVSAATADPAADAVIIFSADPPTITGFTLTNQTQAISGIGLDCGGAPCCIPTGITFHELTWPTGVVDTFNRTDLTGWGTSDNGKTWIPATPTFISGGVGWVTTTAGGAAVQNVSPLGLYDAEIYYETMPPALVTTNGISNWAMLRWSASDNYYFGGATFRSNGALRVSISRRLPSGFTTLFAEKTVGTYGPGMWVSVKFQVNGNTLKVKAWQRGTLEPDWQGVVLDAAITTGTNGGFRTESETSAVPATWTTAYDNVCAYPAVLTGDGYWEIQRSDPITDWKTIMKGDGCSWRMRDFEARVGTVNSYRIRAVNGYNFVGAWSPTVTGMIAAPGVTGTTCANLATDTRTLIFTSNYDQSGLYNLAYVPVWDTGTPTENFAFPEAGTVTFGRMYKRNFQVGFKPTERGGETFTRDILVQAAAVALPKLANVTSLRDMAWQNVPYVCVRDNVGDRWFAFVQVPSEKVQRNGRLYIASVAITEVTDTPYPVTLVTTARDPWLDLDESIGVRTATFRFAHYDGVTGEYLGDITPYIASPTLRHDTGRTVKRSLSLALGIQDASVINPLRDRIWVYMEVNSQSWPLGRYMFTDDLSQVTSVGNLASVQLVDEMFRVDQAISSSFAAFGKQVPRAVVSLLDELDISLNIEASTLTAAVSSPIGTGRGPILTTLSTQGDYETPWMNNQGEFTMIRTVDAATAEPQIDFDTENRIFAGSITRTTDILNAPNRFIVVSNGSGARSAPIVGTYNVPANAPHSIENRGFVIPAVSNIQVNSPHEAAVTARAIGLRSTVVERTTFNTPPDPRHDSYDVCIFAGDRWKEIAWSMNLQEGGGMSHTLVRAYL
jgi:hypothetical protein